jgi:hypothetical protein
LELKQKKITDPSKLIEIEKELVALSLCKPYIEKMPSQYKWLMHINEKIWDMTNIAKTLPVTDPNFASIANSIFEYNQKRFRIKSFFNIQSGSIIQEQKSYASTICIITIDSIDTFYSKLPEINYLSIEYDFLHFVCNDSIDVEDTIYLIYSGKNILRNTPVYDSNNRNISKVTLSEFILIEYRDLFDFCTISYISGGLLGDFIQSLSVIAETFYSTGQRGILYVSDKYGADTFRNGLENTYKDTYEMFSQQIWCKDYIMIFDNVDFDENKTINMNQWRQSSLLCKTNWYNIYKSVYQVEWAKHPWLSLPKVYNVNEHPCKNKILVNMTSYRFCECLNFDLLVSTYDIETILFISNNQNDYEYFKCKYYCDIPCYKPTSFTDFCLAIKSCLLFVGGLSMPLTIAHAFSVNRTICLTNNPDDDIHNVNNPYWYNIDYQFVS